MTADVPTTRAISDEAVALADRIAAVVIPEVAHESRDQRAYDYWRGYRAARDECVEVVRTALAQSSGRAADHAGEARIVAAVERELANIKASWELHNPGVEMSGGLGKLHARLSAAIADEEQGR